MLAYAAAGGAPPRLPCSPTVAPPTFAPQISDYTHSLLGPESGEWLFRGAVDVKGKGLMRTWLQPASLQPATPPPDQAGKDLLD